MATKINSPVMKNPQASEGTYGVSIEIDYQAIEEADKLLAECEKYIDDTKSEMFVLPFVPSFSILATNVRAWRSKRKDGKLVTGYQILEPKIADSEKALRGIIGDVVEKKGALRMQAKHLYVRLEKCIKYNQDLLHTTEGPLEETRNYVNTLSNESKILKDMLTFNTEVLKLHAIENHTKNAIYGTRWVPPRHKQSVPEVDLSKDIDNNLIQEKLKSFRELRERFVSFLAVLLEKRGVQQSNLDNCIWSMDALKSAIKREGVIDENNELEDDNIFSFDHSRCADCAYGYAVACDCMSHITALQKQVHDANKRLQSLVEIRERMRESYESVMAQTEGESPMGPPANDGKSKT